MVAERIAENTWKIQDTVLRMPVVIRDAALAGAVYACRAATVRRVVAGTGLDPVVVGGRGFAVLICVRYRDGDLGPYNEVGLMVAVRGPGGVGSYTLELPVTQTFTLEAGRAIWGLPKWLARCELTIGPRRSTVHLMDGDEFVLAGVLDTGPVALPGTIPSALPAYGQRDDGPIIGGTAAMHLRGVRIRPGGTRLVLGEHRMSEAARALGLEGRALCTVTAPRLRMELGEWN
jgi:hypothetical protein